MKKFLTLGLTSLFFISPTKLLAQDKVAGQGVYFDMKSGKYFVNQKAQFLIKPTENNPYLDRIEVSIDEGEFKKYDNKISFNRDGAHLIRFKAVDPVKNWSPVQTFQIYVDMTTPKTSYQWRGPAHEGKDNRLYVSPQSQLSLNAQDNLSGINHIFYQWKDQKPSTFSSSLKFEGSGEQMVTFYSKDNVGNVEKEQVHKFFVDALPPKSNVSVQGTSFGTPTVLYTNLGSKLLLDAQDKESGVDRIEYMLNDQKVQNNKEGILLEKKENLLSYRAVDKVENQEEWNKLKVILDTEMPSVNLQMNGTYKKSAGKIFAKPGFSLNAQVADSESGLDKIVVSMNSKSVDVKDSHYSTNFEKEEMSFFSLTALDKVGNKAEPINLEIVVDNTFPQTQMASTNAMVQEKDMFYSSLPNKIVLNSMDMGVGVDRIEISYDGKNFEKYKDPIDLSTWASKNRSLYYRGVDFLGNVEPAKSINVSIVDHGPAVALFVETEDAGAVPLSQAEKDLEKKQQRSTASQKK